MSDTRNSVVSASSFPLLGSPCNIGNMQLKNRMVMSPMTTAYCNDDQTPSERYDVQTGSDGAIANRRSDHAGRQDNDNGNGDEADEEGDDDDEQLEITTRERRGAAVASRQRKHPLRLE